MKKFAKILLASLLLLLALIASLLAYGEWIVSDTRQYTYDEVSKVPYNPVAVVLGTSKYLAGGGPNHYFKYRIKAAAELYNNAKVDYILVSGDNATLQYNEPRQMRRALIKAGSCHLHGLRRIPHAGFRGTGQGGVRPGALHRGFPGLSQ